MHRRVLLTRFRASSRCGQPACSSRTAPWRHGRANTESRGSIAQSRSTRRVLRIRGRREHGELDVVAGVNDASGRVQEKCRAKFSTRAPLVHTTSTVDRQRRVQRRQKSLQKVKLIGRMSSRSSTSSQGLVLKSPRSPVRQLQYPPSPPLSHESDEDESLRALELSDGSIQLRSSRVTRSYSISGFDFQHDLLPLSTSLSEAEGASERVGEKNISLISGSSSLMCCIDELKQSIRYCACCWHASMLLCAHPQERD